MPCIDNGQVTCWDGNCADTYAQCPEISSEWGSEDYDVGQYDNPWLQDAGIEGDVFLPGPNTSSKYHAAVRTIRCFYGK